VVDDRRQLRENGMTKSAKSEQLRMRLERLDAALVPGSSSGDVRPVALKAEAGADKAFCQS
jgi:hypothetical protein